MRHHFPTQPDLQITPIEKIRLPLKRRDELPPILAGLQWIWTHPTLKAEVFALLEAQILAGKQATGRPGMDLWQILVFGVVRLGLDADGDRLADLANHHLLVRQRLGVPATPWGQDAKVFGHQTLRDPDIRCRDSTTNCSNKSTRALPPPDARGSQQKAARPSRRWKSRGIPTSRDWKPMCLSPPT